MRPFIRRGKELFKHKPKTAPKKHVPGIAQILFGSKEALTNEADINYGMVVCPNCNKELSLVKRLDTPDILKR